MELRHIKYFLALAEELHFGRAARKLNISQPPFSRQIRDLEEELQVILFERSKRKVALTQAGWALLNDANQLIAQANRVQHIASRLIAGEKGQLRIGCVASAMYDIVPPIIRRFSERFPGVHVTINDCDTAPAMDDLLRNGIDIGFLRLDVVNPPLILRPLRADTLVAVIPRGHRLTRERILNLKDLSKEPIAMPLRRVSPWFYDSIMAGFFRAKVTPNIVYEDRSTVTLICIAASGLAISIVPSSAHRVQIPGAIYRKLHPPIPITDVAIVWNRSNRSSVVPLFNKVVEEVFPL